MFCKVNLAFGLVLKIIEDGMCRYFYANENKTLMERAKLACTQADMTNLMDRIQKLDIFDICTEKEPIQSGNFKNLQI